MRPMKALSAIMEDGGHTKASLSKRLGKNRAYINNYYGKGIVPRVDTYSKIIDACDYDLVARSRSSGKEIVITQEDTDNEDG